MEPLGKEGCDGFHFGVLIGDVAVAVETVCVQALIFRGLVTSALFISSGLFIKRPDGSYLFTGSRPGTGHWHGHGYCARSIWVLRGMIPVSVRRNSHETATGSGRDHQGRSACNRRCFLGHNIEAERLRSTSQRAEL